MDITLQNHRAINLAHQLIKNPVVDITGDCQNSGPPAAAVGMDHSTTHRTAVIPTPVPTIKTEPIKSKPPRKIIPNYTNL
jgi:hypothetical protein